MAKREREEMIPPTLKFQSYMAMETLDLTGSPNLLYLLLDDLFVHPPFHDPVETLSSILLSVHTSTGRGKDGTQEFFTSTLSLRC